MMQHVNIKLRAPEPQDVDFLFELENDRKLWHVSQTLVPFSRFDLEQYIFSVNKQEPFAAGQVRFIIEYIESTENRKPVAIGTADIFALDAINRRAGVGIAILEKYRGRSLAGQALDLLIEYGFNFLNLHQLYCNVEQTNEASLRLFESRRFEVAGVKKQWNRVNGEWVDEYLLQRISKD